MQHLSFGPLDGLVVEVFPVLGGGLAWADVDALEWELQTTPVPFLQNELRAGRTVDRESDDPRLNSYPDEWFETVQQYADAVRLLRTGAARPWQPAPDEPTRDRSLWLFSWSSPIRRFAAHVISHPAFESVILVAPPTAPTHAVRLPLEVHC